MQIWSKKTCPVILILLAAALKLNATDGPRQSGRRFLGCREPPHCTRPVLESLGAAYDRAGQYTESRAAFEKILKTRPNSGFAYSAIAGTCAITNVKAESNEFYKQFLKVCENADADPAAVSEAVTRLKNNP